MPADRERYGWWHSDPGVAREYIAILEDAYRLLNAKDTLAASDAERIFAGIFRILCDEESETDFDDAWDTLDHLGSRHSAAIPVLTKELLTGRHRGLCQHVHDYILRALGKIDPEGSQVRYFLTQIGQESDPEVRKRAADALKTLEKSPMKSFRLYTG